MRDVWNNHASVSMYLVPKRVLSCFPKKRAKWNYFPPFLFLGPLCLFYNWHVNLLFLSDELGRMGTLTYSSRWISHSL